MLLPNHLRQPRQLCWHSRDNLVSVSPDWIFLLASYNCISYISTKPFYCLRQQQLPVLTHHFFDRSTRLPILDRKFPNHYSLLKLFYLCSIQFSIKHMNPVNRYIVFSVLTGIIHQNQKPINFWRLEFLVELGGIEPPSCDDILPISTCVVRASNVSRLSALPADWRPRDCSSKKSRCQTTGSGHRARTLPTLRSLSVRQGGNVVALSGGESVTFVVRCYFFDR